MTQPDEKEQFRHVISITRNWADEVVPAVLILFSYFETPQVSIDEFRSAVNKWLRSTPTGKKAWHDTRGQFNYGDLTEYTSQPTLKAYLKEAGIYSAEIKSLEPSMDLDEFWDKTFNGDKR